MPTWAWALILVSTLVGVLGTLAYAGYRRAIQEQSARLLASPDQADHLRPVDRQAEARPQVAIRFGDDEEVRHIRETVGAVAPESGHVDDSEAELEVGSEAKPEDADTDTALLTELASVRRQSPDVLALDFQALRHSMQLPTALRELRQQSRLVSLHRQLARTFVVLTPSSGRFDSVVKALRFLDVQTFDAAILVQPTGRSISLAMRSEFPELIVAKPQHAGEPPLLTAERATSGWQDACASDRFVCIGDGVYTRPDVVSRLLEASLAQGNASWSSVAKHARRKERGAE